MAHLRNKDARQSFEYFDGGCKGKLTRHELKCALVSLFGVPPSKAEMKAIMDVATRGFVDWPLFNALVADRIRPSPGELLIRAAFDTFCDKGVAKRELISSQMFMAVLKQHAPFVDHGRARKAFLELDSDGDGCLNYFDFAAALRSDVP